MEIKAVQYVADYAIKVLFTNGENKVIDLYGYLKKSKQPMTKKFLDVKLFREYNLRNSGGITWKGQLDLDADWLYNYDSKQAIKKENSQLSM